MSSFAAHQQRPSARLFSTVPAATTHAPECCPSICLCSTGACEARQHGQTTEENELAEQLCSELLSSSGSNFNFAHFDGASADAAAAAAAAAAVAEAAAALADLLCHAGCPQEAAAAVSHLFPAAHSISVHCSTAACPGQLTLGLHPAQHGACCFDACTCSAADVLLRSAAAVCTLDCGQEPLSEAEQAALAALGEMLGRQLRQHVKQQLEVLHAAVASLRIQGAPSAHCTKQLMGH